MEKIKIISKSGILDCVWVRIREDKAKKQKE